MALIIDYLGKQTQASNRKKQIQQALQNLTTTQNPSWGQFKLLDQQLSLAQSVKPTTTPTTNTTTPTTPSWGQFKVLDAQLSKPTTTQNLSYTATTNPSWGSFKVLDAQLNKQPTATQTATKTQTTSASKPVWYQDPSRKVTIYDFTSGQPKPIGEGYIGPDNKTYVNVNGKWVWVRDLYPNAEWTWNTNPNIGQKYIGIVSYTTPTNLSSTLQTAIPNLTSLLQSITPTQGLSQEFVKIPTTEELQKEAEAIYNPIYDQRAQEIKQAIEQAKSNVSNQMLSRGLARSSYAVDKIAEVEAQGQKQLEQLDQERRAQIANYMAQQRENAINRAMQAQQYNAGLSARNAQIAATLANILGTLHQQKQSAELFPIQKETAQTELTGKKQQLQQSAELFPIQKEAAQTELAGKKQQLQQSAELFPIQKEAAQTELAGKKLELNVKEQMAPIEIKQATEQLRNMQLTNDKLAKMTPLELQQLGYQIKLLAQNYEKNKQIIPYEVKQAALEVDKAKLQNGILEQELKQQQINTEKLQKMLPYEIEQAYWQVQLLKQQYNQNNKKFPLELKSLESQILTEATRRAIMNEENFRNNELFKANLAIKGAQLAKAQADLQKAQKQGEIDAALGAAISKALSDVRKSGISIWDWLYQPAKDSKGKTVIDQKTKKPVTNAEVLSNAGMLQPFLDFVKQYTSATAKTDPSQLSNSNPSGK